jgi:hypothetical protein
VVPRGGLHADRFRATAHITKLHSGLKGLMSSLFLDNLIAHTKRGMAGVVRGGRHPDGKVYGSARSLAAEASLRLSSRKPQSCGTFSSAILPGPRRARSAASSTMTACCPAGDKTLRVSTIMQLAACNGTTQPNGRPPPNIAGHACCRFGKNVTVVECCDYTLAGIASLGQAEDNHDPARLVIALHEKAPVTASRPGAFHYAFRVKPMSFIATFVSLAVMIGGAVVVLTTVAGYACYSSLRALLCRCKLSS